MSGECETCGEHTLECECNKYDMKLTSFEWSLVGMVSVAFIQFVFGLHAEAFFTLAVCIIICLAGIIGYLRFK